jgi:hypothetical protein
MDTFRVTLTKLKDRRLSLQIFWQLAILDLKEPWF